MYSSKLETKEHILNVTEAMGHICSELLKRALNHDASKLVPPELEYFDKFTPLLKTLKYGTPKYQASLDELKPALDHHYAHNRHHPEHHKDGVSGMNLVDIIEMFCDWYAATKRTKDGSFENSIEISCKRFQISEQLTKIFHNARKELF